MSKAKKAAPAGPVTLRWTLDELPSAQHRAGLAGLCLMVPFLHRRPGWEGTCALEVEPTAATLTVDLPGLTALLDEVYAASAEEEAVEKPYLDAKKEVKPPLRTEERTVLKNGKEKVVTLYVYPKVVPGGGPLVECEPEAPADPEGKGKASALHGRVWIKLWRDMIWTIYRGVPATRLVFAARAEGGHSGMEEDLFKALRQVDAVAEQTSSLMLGAQATTADGVPFGDLARTQLLLHFTPFATAIYVPQVVAWDRKEKRLSADKDGFALAFPEVADLTRFCAAWPRVLKQRSGEVAGYLPRQALIDVPAEAGLDPMVRLEAAVAADRGDASARAVAAYDVVHTRKDGNNVRVLGLTRVEPARALLDEWARLRGAHKSPLIRQQRLINLMAERPRWSGFDRLVATTSVDLFIPRSQGDRPPYDAWNVQHDLRAAFTEAKESSPMPEATDPVPGLVLRVVSTYINHKLGAKYELTWSTVKDAQNDDPGRRDYQEKREKVGRDAFLAVRSRTGADFTDYFVSTLCSAPQRLKEEDFLTLSRALTSDTDTVRTLTLLALSARS
ncbi:MAG: type I-MYXAN CRISPR-associated protein Cmx8 [Deltaproteobacteria bacterium]|nr:type I-MYXAN CRISPR-associated protein Cmx8 [Deltaproteobacteria bacterium]